MATAGQPHVGQSDLPDAVMRSPNRAHDRQSFFKYMSADTAKIVLARRTLRWSSPVLFNDPFDVPRELSFGLRPDEIVEALACRISMLIEQPPEDTSNLEAGVRLIVDAVKAGIPQELKIELLDGIRNEGKTHRPSGESMDALRAMWRAWLPEFRILCLTESPAHLAMWYHYADAYRGAVLEFRCDDALDSAWLAARRVTYPAERPAVYTASGWASLLTMSKGLAIRAMLDAATFTKAPDWSYENEWRVTSFKRATDEGHYTDYRFHPEELAAVYVGPMASADDRNSIVALASQFPRARVWGASIGMNRELVLDPWR